MQTITSYKVVYIDSMGAIQELDFTEEQPARDYKNSHPGSKLYLIRMLGQITEII